MFSSLHVVLDMGLIQCSLQKPKDSLILSSFMEKKSHFDQSSSAFLAMPHGSTECESTECYVPGSRWRVQLFCPAMLEAVAFRGINESNAQLWVVLSGGGGAPVGYFMAQPHCGWTNSA